MAEHGLCGFLADNGGRDPADQRLLVGDAWAADAARYRPAFVRAPINEGIAGEVWASRLGPALAAYRRRAIEPIPVFSQSFHQPWLRVGSPGQQALYAPNAPLTLHGPEYGPVPINEYIQWFSLKAAAVAHPLAITRAFVWNEPNIKGLGVKPGQYCPPSPATQAALAPEVCAALWYCTGLRLLHVGVTHPYTGGLTCLIERGTDPSGTWVKGYLDAVYTWLARWPLPTLAHGTVYPWRGITVNIEGPVNDAYCATVVEALGAVLRKHHDTSTLIAGEWGIKDARYDPAVADAAYAAVDRHFATAAYFSHPLSEQWALTGWEVSGTQYLATTQTASGAWYEATRKRAP